MFEISVSFWAKIALILGLIVILSIAIHLILSVLSDFAAFSIVSAALDVESFALAIMVFKKSMNKSPMFGKRQSNSSGEKGKASEIIAKQIGVSAKTVEKTRLVLKEGTPEQIEAIKKDELSMNQVFNQIVEKRKSEKAEKEEVKTSSQSNAPSSHESDSLPLSVKTNVSTTKEKKAAASKKTRKTYEDGIKFAISQIKNGVTLEELEKSLSA
ncbi:MAG: hypothetical protein MJ182_10260 [Treponema sp.]|nr:hypothetical protein [Treponema sp.]